MLESEAIFIYCVNTYILIIQVYIQYIMYKSKHKISVPAVYFFIIIIVYFILGIYVCMLSSWKTTTNSMCVCAHLMNKAHSDSDSDSDVSRSSWNQARVLSIIRGPLSRLCDYKE